MGLAKFAGKGQGTGARKANVAKGGRQTPADRALKSGFTSGKGKVARRNIDMKQAPAGPGRKGVRGTSLPLGKQKGDSTGKPGQVPGGRGVRSPSLPVGRQNPTITPSTSK